jgi:hypothetical protein
VQNEPNFAPPEAGAEGKMCKTNPIWPRRRVNTQNEPNFAPPEAADGGNCAKRSQTWGDWGMWEEAVVVWGVARPGSEMRKTNPISPRRTGDARKVCPVWSCKCQVREVLHVAL